MSQTGLTKSAMACAAMLRIGPRALLHFASTKAKTWEAIDGPNSDGTLNASSIPNRYLALFVPIELSSHIRLMFVIVHVPPSRRIVKQMRANFARRTLSVLPTIIKLRNS